MKQWIMLVPSSTSIPQGTRSHSCCPLLITWEKQWKMAQVLGHLLLTQKFPANGSGPLQSFPSQSLQRKPTMEDSLSLKHIFKNRQKRKSKGKFYARLRVTSHLKPGCCIFNPDSCKPVARGFRQELSAWVPVSHLEAGIGKSVDGIRHSAFQIKLKVRGHRIPSLQGSDRLP